ncbi:MAG: hypothetical protein WCK21_05555 [Actinomycetota bacterium]
MSHWARIELENQAPAVPRPGPPTGRARAVPRLRRSERLVVGAIDGGAHVLQRRARDLLVGAGVLMVPMAGLYVLLSVVAYGQFDRFDNLLGDHGYLGVEKGLGLIAITVQSLTAHIVGAYAAIYVVRYQLGGEPSMWPMLKQVGRRLPVLFALWALQRGVPLLLIGLIYLNNDNAVLVGLGLLFSPFLALISTWTLFVAPVAMCEEAGFGAFRRARRLAKARRGSVYSFVWAAGFVAAVLLGCITSLPGLAGSTKLLTFGHYRWLAEGLAAQLALLVVMPFSGAATAQMYLQTRVHGEGLDIALSADRAFGVQR